MDISRYAAALLVLALLSGARLFSAEAEKTDPELLRFVKAKRSQLETLIDSQRVNPPPLWQQYFSALERGEWEQTTNLFSEFRRKTGLFGPVPPDSLSQEEIEGARAVWPIVAETFSAWEQFRLWDSSLLRIFADGIIQSIPPGSIYFGGTDSGRFLITAGSESHVDGRPFFTLTQNALADNGYLKYLRSFYSSSIEIPTEEDSRRCFQAYVEDARARFEHDQLHPDEPKRIRPGEEVRVVGQRVSISGRVAVMAINAGLVRVILNKNPDRPIFIEESYPLDSLHSHLVPHGFIFRLNPTPVERLTSEVLEEDRRFWGSKVDQWVGSWLKPDTELRAVSEFARQAYGQTNLAGFTGDRRYVTNATAQGTFSKCRAAIAGNYYWRSKNAPDSALRQRMLQEAELAFKQAFALGPRNSETVFNYVTLLGEQARFDDAMRLLATGKELIPEEKSFKELEQLLIKLRKSPPARSQ